MPFVFGWNKPSASMIYKLVINADTKQYEKGFSCYNGGHHIDVYAKKKDIDEIEQYLISVGYTRLTESKRFGEE